jgi:hypothetical protein
MASSGAARSIARFIGTDISDDGFGAALAAHGGGIGLAQQLGGGQFVEDGQRQQQRRTHQRHPAEQRMQQEDHEKVGRHPGHVVQRQRARRTEEAAHRAEVAQRLHPVGAAAQLALDGAGEALGSDLFLEPIADALHDARPRAFQQRHQRQRDDGNEGQIQQRVQVARGQHAVEHLHHVQRDGELQHIDHAAEQAHRDELGAAGRDRARQGRGRRRRLAQQDARVSRHACPPQSASCRSCLRLGAPRVRVCAMLIRPQVARIGGDMG